MNIICLSTQNWDDSFWTNKQHIMSQLSKDHRVIYVDRGVLGLRYFFYKRITASNTIFSLKFFFRLFEERTKNLTILTEKFNFPIPFAFKSWLVKRYIKKHKIKDPILWIYQPEYEKYIGQFGEKLVVYDCVDEYSAFPSYKNKKDEIIETEKRLMRKADLVITSSEHLYQVKKQFNPRTYLIHNVADYDHFVRVFEKDLPLPKDIKNIPKPIIGFIGAIDSYKVNLDLLDNIAENRPNYSIVLIGSIGKVDSSTRISSLRKRKNVFFLGEKPYGLLPNYINSFDVCMIPYNLNDYTENCFPIKFFEFMATGKPVIATALPALANYAEYIEYVKTNNDFVLGIDKLLKGDNETQKMKRVEIARNNSWQTRIDKITEKFGSAAQLS
ncbi:MAG: group 1 glycosyl transferase [Candidatus Saganbacteria bacterium]|uniref:Group 1 glycosyl transferase n=1 Tax=Candidatus Saganbacteria bacterium TaxID=2575572 RepID=A0A833KZQ8_UNCSA|nr:MAG: group 1 glycosyl transferase [Candidatus Saganbacteria bacterium]